MTRRVSDEVAHDAPGRVGVVIPLRSLADGKLRPLEDFDSEQNPAPDSRQYIYNFAFLPNRARAA